MIKDVLCFNLLQIGELAKRFEPNFIKEYGNVPWKNIKGMRDRKGEVIFLHAVIRLVDPAVAGEVEGHRVFRDRIRRISGNAINMDFPEWSGQIDVVESRAS